MAGTALAAGLLASAAYGQQAKPDASATSGVSTVGEVVITANRRSDTVHNAPLSVSAVTPQQIENQGLKTAQDIARVVPALRIGSTNGNVGQVDIAVRGIRAASGAATTGTYIDDVSITQRNTSNPLPGGTVLPQLFDLERVEVLRGPQGTLYGGSSEGGTLRFITPQPSLTAYSGRARVEGSSTEGGAGSYDLGVAVGGPLVQDKLGFRLSADYRYDGGYIDHVSQFTGRTLAQNTNNTKNTSVHAILKWAPTDRAAVTLSYLYTKTENADADSYWENIPNLTGLITYVTNPTTVNYGSFNMFGPYKSGANSNVGRNFYTSDSQLKALLSPNLHEMHLPSLAIDYDFGEVNFKSITSYVKTTNTGAFNFSYADVVSQTSTNSPYVANLPLYNSVFSQHASNTSSTQEFRLSSNNPASPLTWLVGVYYNDNKLDGGASINANLGDLLVAATGLPPAVFPGFNGQILNFPQQVEETSTAGFGELTYSITPKLKATAGARITNDRVRVHAFQGGALFNPANPTALLTSADVLVNETPVTPKFGLQYIVDNNTNLYANAAKGYRSGGANNDLRQSSCVSSLVQTFGSAAKQPLQYNSDTLWSYEGGAKVRTLGGRADINASVFYIDWKNPQVYYFLPCSQPIAISANADVISKGADVEASFKLFEGFTATANIGYTDATYDGVVNTGPGTPTILNKGDRVPYTPKWTVSLAGQYDFHVMNRPAFIHADYQTQSSIVLSGSAGSSTYTPDNYSLPATHIVSARAGMAFDAFNVSLFVNNLTNSTDLTSRAGLSPGAQGRSGCIDVACTTFAKVQPGALLSTFRPRTVGLSVDYHY